MQNLFNKSKRKYVGDDSCVDDPGVSRRKHRKHNTNHEQKPRGPSLEEDTILDAGSNLGILDPISTGQKLANLIHSLDDVLDEDGMDEMMRLVGDERFHRCLELRSSLQQLPVKVSLAPTKVSSQTKAHDFFNIPKSISPSSVTRWKASTIPTTLPPLPKILDPTLEASAFIHVALGRGAPTDLSYERLEWIGDAYIYLTSSLLISQTFPTFTPGKCSQMRERLIKNLTLAEYSRQYGFDKRARLPPDLTGGSLYPAKKHEQTKALGDIFEAYVAAVVLSDPADGVGMATEWLKDVWGMTLAKDIIYEERNGFQLDSPLWRLRGTAEPIQEVKGTAQQLPLNAKEQLQQLIGAKGIKLTYRDAAPVEKDPTNRLPLFTVGVYLDGWGENNKMLASGKANGKKDAGMKAAQMALDNKRAMKIYAEKKKLFDAQTELEREALEKLLSA